jgi:hypothetical protein
MLIVSVPRPDYRPAQVRGTTPKLRRSGARQSRPVTESAQRGQSVAILPALRPGPGDRGLPDQRPQVRLLTGRVERRRASLDQWLPLYLPFPASWQMAIRSCPRFLHPLGSFRTAGVPQYGWKPAGSSCTLPHPSPAAFDAGPAVLSVSGSESRRLGPRLYPQALGSARFIIPAPAIATTA